MRTFAPAVTVNGSSAPDGGVVDDGTISEYPSSLHYTNTPGFESNTPGRSNPKRLSMVPAVTATVSNPTAIPSIFGGWGPISNGVYKSYNIDGATYVFDALSDNGVSVSTSHSDTVTYDVGAPTVTANLGGGFGNTTWTASDAAPSTLIEIDDVLTGQAFDFGDTTGATHSFSTTYSKRLARNVALSAAWNYASGSHSASWTNHAFLDETKTVRASGATAGSDDTAALAVLCPGGTQSADYIVGTGSASIAFIDPATVDLTKAGCRDCPRVYDIDATIWMETDPFTGDAPPGVDSHYPVEIRGDPEAVAATDPTEFLVKPVRIQGQVVQDETTTCGNYRCRWGNSGSATYTGPSGNPLTGPGFTIERVGPKLYRFQGPFNAPFGVYFKSGSKCPTSVATVEQQPLPFSVHWDETNQRYGVVWTQSGDPSFTTNKITLTPADCDPAIVPVYICDTGPCVGCGLCESTEGLLASVPIEGTQTDCIATRESSHPCRYSFDGYTPEGDYFTGTIVYEPPGTDELGQDHAARYRMRTRRESDDVVLSDNVMLCEGGTDQPKGDYFPTPGSDFEDDAYVTEVP